MKRILAVAFALLAVVAAPADALTTGHTGTGRPALAVSGGRLYVGWTGSTGTGAKELDLGWSVNGGQTITRVSWVERVPVGEGPALDGDGTGVYVAWSAANHGNALTVEYFDGTALSCRTAFADAVTLRSPALATDAAGVRWIAWTDPDNHLNVARLDISACATAHTMALTDRILLRDLAASGPALVYDSSGSSNLGLVIAWTDASHGLRVASFDGAALTNRATVTTPVGASGAPGLGAAVSDLYLGFVGTDGNVYLAYSEGCIPTCFNASPTGQHGISGYGMTSDGGTTRSAFFDATGHLVL